MAGSSEMYFQANPFVKKLIWHFGVLTIKLKSECLCLLDIKELISDLINALKGTTLVLYASCQIKSSRSLLAYWEIKFTTKSFLKLKKQNISGYYCTAPLMLPSGNRRVK